MAIGACSYFMRDIGLQGVLATPDEKRHVFMEVVDTIVNVNRTGDEVMIDTEHLTEKARDALAAADPYRKGFDAFKAELVAAEETVVPSDEAAECRISATRTWDSWKSFSRWANGIPIALAQRRPRPPSPAAEAGWGPRRWSR